MYERYWYTAYRVIQVWGQYNSVKKLFYNASHSETRRRVWHVVKNYYDGSLDRVKRREYDLDCSLNNCLAAFKEVCEQFGIETINRDWLYDNLRCASDYAKVREKIERRQNNDRDPVSLKHLLSP